MAASAMGKYLALAAAQAREDAGRRTFHIAASPPGKLGLDPSTVWRFERGGRWPRNPDLVVDLYAADLDIEPIELWKRALEMWERDERAERDDGAQ